MQYKHSGVITAAVPVPVPVPSQCQRKTVGALPDSQLAKVASVVPLGSGVAVEVINDDDMSWLHQDGRRHD